MPEATALGTGDEVMEDKDEVEEEADGEADEPAEWTVVEGEDADDTTVRGPSISTVGRGTLATGSRGLTIVVVVAVVARAFCSPLWADTTAPAEPAKRSLGRLSSGVGVSVPVIERVGEPRLTAAVPGFAETDVVVTVGGSGDPTRPVAGLVALRQRSWRHWIKICNHLIYRITMASSRSSIEGFVGVGPTWPLPPSPVADVAVVDGISVADCSPAKVAAPCILTLILVRILLRLLSLPDALVEPELVGGVLSSWSL